VDCDRLPLGEKVLQLGQGDVALLAHFTAEEALLPLRQALRLTAAVRAGREVAALTPLPEHLLDEGGADAEAGGDLGDGAFPLLVGGDDPLA
jgi:hypothetical protein